MKNRKQPTWRTFSCEPIRRPVRFTEMERRAFLTLIASAPIAALAPWPMYSVLRAEAARTKYWPMVDGANQAGPSLVADGFEPSATIAIGDIFSIDYTYSVHPATGAPLAVPRTFVVTATVTANKQGQAVLPIYPPIIPTGYYQNISNSPYNDALLIPQRGWGIPAVAVQFDESYNH